MTSGDSSFVLIHELMNISSSDDREVLNTLGFRLHGTTSARKKISPIDSM